MTYDSNDNVNYQEHRGCAIYNHRVLRRSIDYAMSPGLVRITAMRRSCHNQSFHTRQVTYM